MDNIWSGASWWSAGNGSNFPGGRNRRGQALAEGRVDWTLNDLPQVNVPTEEEFEALKAKLNKKVNSTLLALAAPRGGL